MSAVFSQCSSCFFRCFSSNCRVGDYDVEIRKKEDISSSSSKVGDVGALNFKFFRKVTFFDRLSGIPTTNLYGPQYKFKGKAANSTKVTVDIDGIPNISS